MKKTLLVIDVQEYFINENTKEIPKKIADFIYSRKVDKILFFRFTNKKDSNWIRILKWRKMLTESETKLAIQLQKYVHKDNVFIKRAAFSVFRVKEFVEYLETNNISELYICGMDTNACVYTSTMEAFERGYDIKVIEDLCMSHQGKKYHKNAIDSLIRNLGKSSVITSKDIN